MHLCSSVVRRSKGVLIEGRSGFLSPRDLPHFFPQVGTLSTVVRELLRTSAALAALINFTCFVRFFNYGVAAWSAAAARQKSRSVGGLGWLRASLSFFLPLDMSNGVLRSLRRCRQLSIAPHAMETTTTNNHWSRRGKIIDGGKKAKLHCPPGRRERERLARTYRNKRTFYVHESCHKLQGPRKHTYLVSVWSHHSLNT